MAIFNVAFLNPKLRRGKSGGVKSGLLLDEIQLLENELMGDSDLSLFDYDRLINKTMEKRNIPGQTESQYSNWDVKISDYQKRKSIAKIEKNEDIKRRADHTTNTKNVNTKMYGNNPREWMTTLADMHQSDIIEMEEIIERREMAGQDATEYYTEMAESERQYEKYAEMRNTLNRFDKNTPTGIYAYVITNDNGEIINIDYSEEPSRSGFIETEGMIDGCVIQGKAKTVGGNNKFQLGNMKFEAMDKPTFDPRNPLAIITEKLKLTGSEKELEEKGLKKTASDYYNFSSKSKFINPTTGNEETYNTFPVASDFIRNTWAKSGRGTDENPYAIYKRKEDGGYEKYYNFQSMSGGVEVPEGMPERDEMLTLTDGQEKDIRLDDSIDMSERIMPVQEPEIETGMPFQDTVEQPAYMQKPIQPVGVEQQPEKTAQIRRTPQQPKQTASEGIGATAQRTIKSGVDYFRNLFS